MLRVYKIAIERNEDGAYDHHLSFRIRGRLGDTHPTDLGTFVSNRDAMNAVMADVEETESTEYTVEVYLSSIGG